MAASARVKSAKVVGRYVLHDQIATGGMASVHVGRFLGPAGFTRTVAIKQLHPQYAQNPEFSQMFLDEAHLASRIRHPNVVSVLDVVSENDELLLIMEYVPGASLSRLLRRAAERHEHVPPGVAAAILTGVLHGLHAAHEARDESNQDLGVVHRDVSPQNIMVGADGIARVLDFGVAKAAGRAQTTRDGQLKGKMAYMAPEQLQGRPVDRRTDVYAAAVVLWETLTGDPLFAGENDVEVFGKVLAGAKVKPSELCTDLDPAFDEVTMCGLAQSPDDRFATAREMAQSLARRVPIATPADVSDWVQLLAKDELDERSARVAVVETGTIVGGDIAAGAIATRDVAALPPSTAPGPLPFVGENDAATTFMIARAAAALGREPKPRAVGPWVAVVLMVGAGIFAVRALLQRDPVDNVRPAVAHPTEPPSAAPVSTPAASPPPLAPSVIVLDDPATKTPVARPSTTPPPIRTPETAPAPPPAAKPKVRVAPKPPVKPKNDCDPPYYFDSAGVKRYKRECD